MRRDGQGLTHAAYTWGETFWEPLCEVYTVQARRDTDEPAGTLVTCMRCWYYALRGDAEGQVKKR